MFNKNKLIKNKYKTILTIFSFMLFIFFFDINLAKASIDSGHFFKWNQKKYFIVYSNIRNYDAYGFAFELNGKDFEKIFLGKGMTDKGYIMSYGKDILISNPSQGTSYIINKKGFINNININQEGELPISHIKYVLSYYPYIIIFSNNENAEFSNKNNINSLEPNKIIISKDLMEDKKIFNIKCKWISQVFINEEILYVIIKKDKIEKKYFIEGYNINTGLKIKEDSFPTKGLNTIPNPKDIIVKKGILAFAYNDNKKNQNKDKILFYDLKNMKIIKEFYLPEKFIFNRINYESEKFSISGSFKDNLKGQIYKYFIVDSNFNIIKNFEITPSLISYEKKEFVLKDVLEDKKNIYVFSQIYNSKKTNKKNKNLLNELLFILWSILGGYEGPKNESIVCIYDKKTEKQIEKTELNISDERLKNGVMIPFLLKK